jgi:hypothetical protein
LKKPVAGVCDPEILDELPPSQRPATVFQRAVSSTLALFRVLKTGLRK